MSLLETALLRAPGIDPHAEHEIDTLRCILQGTVGTKAQRAMVIRVLKQVEPKKPIAPKLFRHLTGDYVRHTYLNH
jgi:hypothetical protein